MSIIISDYVGDMYTEFHLHNHKEVGKSPESIWCCFQTIKRAARAYKRRNTGAGKYYFCHFFRSPDKDALTKWRPAQRTARYSLFLHSLGKNMSVSHGQTKHKLTETLLCLVYAFMSEKLRAALLNLRAAGSAREVATPR